MKMIIEEQELIDAAAYYGAMENRIPIDTVSIELFFEEGKGFFAHLYQDRSSRTIFMNEQNLIDAIAVYLRDQHQFDPNRLGIELLFEDGKGFFAGVEY
jgi:hypothetical protein